MTYKVYELKYNSDMTKMSSLECYNQALALMTKILNATQGGKGRMRHLLGSFLYDFLIVSTDSESLLMDDEAVMPFVNRNQSLEELKEKYLPELEEITAILVTRTLTFNNN
jgi:hypothetical protein